VPDSCHNDLARSVLGWWHDLALFVLAQRRCVDKTAAQKGPVGPSFKAAARVRTPWGCSARPVTQFFGEPTLPSRVYPVVNRKRSVLNLQPDDPLFGGAGVDLKRHCHVRMAEPMLSSLHVDASGHHR
jgi:hypothetical protein